MAQVQPINQINQTTIHDVNGDPVLSIGERAYTVIEPDGTISRLQLLDNIQLVDGLAWSPSMASGPNPVFLTTCPTCREPPISLFKHEPATHGLLSVRNARVCTSCGQITCPRHRRLVGRGWRCLSCARWAGLARVIKPIFFSLQRES